MKKTVINIGLYLNIKEVVMCCTCSSDIPVRNNFTEESVASLI